MTWMMLLALSGQTYADAYTRADAESRPLVIVVDGQEADLAYARQRWPDAVAHLAGEELAAKLRRPGRSPQFNLYRRRDGKWTRQSLLRPRPQPQPQPQAWSQAPRRQPLGGILPRLRNVFSSGAT